MPVPVEFAFYYMYICNVDSIEPASTKLGLNFPQNKTVVLPFRPFISHAAAAAAAAREKRRLPACLPASLPPSLPLKWHLKPSLATCAAGGHQSPTSSSHCGMARWRRRRRWTAAAVCSLHCTVRGSGPSSLRYSCSSFTRLAEFRVKTYILCGCLSRRADRSLAHCLF